VELTGTTRFRAVRSHTRISCVAGAVVQEMVQALSCP
jgi:hypothetical protein